MDTSRPLSARLGENYLRKIIKESKMANDKKSAEEKGEYDYEGDMAKSQLKSIIANAQRMHDMLEETTNLPEWVQSKITLAEDYILTATSYMEGEMSEEYSIQEKINIAKAKMGDVIKDFKASGAPQFAGRSKEERRQMAIAAKLGAMRKSKMSEELKGNQHKIDANKNNKIDAHDFKLLRSKLKVKKEEVEQIGEAPYMGKGNHKPGWMLRDPELDRKFKEIEARRERMKKNVGKTDDEIAKMKKEEASPMIKPPSNRFGDREAAFKYAKENGGKVYRHEYVNPRSGMKSTTFSVKEEVEQVNELKKSTLGSYIKKASHDVATKSALTRHFATKSRDEKEMHNHTQSRKDDETSNKLFNKSWKRRQGIAKAVDRLAKEEVEQVDEVIGNTTGYSDSGPRNKADERKFHQMRNVVTKGPRTGKITKHAQNRLKARLKDKTYMDK
jgi:hypothetical protein